MIYLDTSVALAQLLAEDQRPPAWLWDETLVASRPLEYALWMRVHARNGYSCDGLRRLMDRRLVRRCVGPQN